LHQQSAENKKRIKNSSLPPDRLSFPCCISEVQERIISISLIEHAFGLLKRSHRFLPNVHAAKAIANPDTCIQVLGWDDHEIGGTKGACVTADRIAMKTDKSENA